MAVSPAALAADAIEWGTCSSTPQPYGWRLEEERPQVVAAAAALPLPVAALHSVDLPFLEVTIRDAEGDALAGALDFVHSQVRWRGASPWSPGSTYTCTIKADNSGLAAKHGSGDALDDWTVTWDFTAVDGPATTVPVEAIEPAATYQRVELVVSGPWVCCDGAYPIVSDHGGSICDVETCGSLRALGKIVVDAGFAASAAPAAITNSVVYLLSPREGGDTWCVDVEVHDVTTGSLAAAGVRCVPRPPGPLGILEHDPSARLATICEGELYTCGTHNESDLGSAWNPDDCTPWTSPGGDATSGAVTAGEDEPIGDDAASDAGGPGVGADEGCTCRGGGPLGAPSFGLGILVVLVGRRRSRR
ncbi:MAG: hypothetical protein KC486_26305 [Myxococcales bacterium]|nr:hypothetical protein [Myxococcales bacterium]